MAVPHRCPKCSGVGVLQYDPQSPFASATACGPWPCNACVNGILWSTADTVKQAPLKVDVRPVELP